MSFDGFGIHFKRQAAMITAAVLVVLAALAAVMIAPAAAQTGVTGQVNAAKLFIRTGPSIVYDPVAVVDQGFVLTLRGRTADSGWLLTDYDGRTGWVSASQLSLSGDVNSLPIITNFTPVAVVRSERLNVRGGPGLQFDVLLILNKDQRVELLGRIPGSAWLQVRSGDVVGWVASGEIESSISTASLPVIPVMQAMPQIVILQPPVVITATPFPEPATQTPQPTPIDAGPTATTDPNAPTATMVPPTATQAPPTATMIPPTPTQFIPTALIIDVERLNVRSGPGLGFPPVNVITGGDYVVLLARNTGTSWVKVRVYDNSEGWINSAYVLPSIPLINLPVENPGLN